MPLRSLVVALVAGAAALASSAALGAPADCVACYRHVVRPPVHAVVTERVAPNPVQAIARTLLPSLPRAKMVTEKVLMAPARNVWQVTRGADGRIVGCWVKVPARYAVRHRRVLEWPRVPRTPPRLRSSRGPDPSSSIRVARPGSPLPSA